MGCGSTLPARRPRLQSGLSHREKAVDSYLDPFQRSLRDRFPGATLLGHRCQGLEALELLFCGRGDQLDCRLFYGAIDETVDSRDF